MDTPHPDTTWDHHHLFHLWDAHLRRSPAYARFLIALSFLITFGIVRLITHGIRHGWLPLGNIGSQNAAGQGLHIHHYIWGIGIALLLGYIQIGFAPKRGRNVCAVLYGIALALILDEFALLLNLRDVYWTGAGRESLNAVAVAGSLAVIAVAGHPFARAAVRDWRNRGRTS